MENPREARIAQVVRTTKETDIDLTINLDGTGEADISTGVPFFDHMLDAFARHGLFDLTVKAQGDIEVSAHHTVEDVGIVLGQAVAKALGDKRGIVRFGTSFVPMDESLIQASLDISGRGQLHFAIDVPMEMLGIFNSSLAKEFLISSSQMMRPWEGSTSNIWPGPSEPVLRMLSGSTCRAPTSEASSSLSSRVT